MKQTSKAKTKNLVKNAIAHVADSHDANKVALMPKEVSKVTLNEEVMAKATDKATDSAQKVVKREETAEDFGFQTAKKETGLPVVCNINGINVGNDCHIECAPNPKRPGSKAHERYEAYAGSATVKEYLDNGGVKADLRYDHAKGFLTVFEVIREGKIVKVEAK